MSSQGQGRAIAIIGLSGRFPGAGSLQEFWQNVRNGVDALQTFTPAAQEAVGVDAATQALSGWVPRGTVLQDVDRFDAAFFGYAPREAQIIDPQQRLFLECAWDVMEHAGYASEPDGRTIGIYAGAGMNSYLNSHLLSNRALLQTVGGYQVMLGNDKDFLTTRASYKLNLHGPSIAVQTACSTSLVAVQMACQALLHGECDMAMAGGVSISFPQGTGYQYQEGMIFSPDGVCRPFDEHAAGTRSGAGVGLVMLKRLDDALADRDTVHAVILGAAINNDGAGKAGYTAPSIEGQMEVIAMAQSLAGVDARSISYLEAHGTGTPLGDPIEIAALTRVYRTSTADRNFCALGSLKANLGHLDVAAGIGGLIKTVLALQHREIPPLAHFRAPNPQLRLESSPFRAPVVVEPWESNGAPRRAAISAFGIGGTNAHAVLEEAPVQEAGRSLRSHQLLVLSARSEPALQAASENLATYLQQNAAAGLADVAHTLQIGRRTFQHRRALVVRDAADAVQQLSADDRAMRGTHDGASRPVAFLFSGQGSQHAGMCRELYRVEPVFAAEVDRCAVLLPPSFGRDLRELLLHGSDEELAATHVAQLVLFVTEYALSMLWKSWGVTPSAMLGHSIGEYVAAHLAGVFSLEDALRVVESRGRFMQSMPAGAMLAVQSDRATVAGLLPMGAEIAAINSASLCTVSGDHAAITEVELLLDAAGIEHRRLHTSHAFHSSMMDGALAPFQEVLASVTLSAPRVRFVSNVTGTWIRADEATSPAYWVRHLRGTVLFADGVATLLADSSVQLLEVGAGTTLTSLARLALGRDGSARAIASLPHARAAKTEVEALLAAAGQLWIAGVVIDWTGMHAHEQLMRVPLPTYPYERQRHWVDPSPAEVAGAAIVAPTVRREARVDDWFYAPAWVRSPLPRGVRQPKHGTWLVFGHEDALHQRVNALLADQGAHVVSVTSGIAFSDAQSASAPGLQTRVVRANEAADYERIVREFATHAQPLAGVVQLFNTTAHRGTTDSGDSDNVWELHAPSALARALLVEAAFEHVRVVMVTTGAQSALGERVMFPRRALVTGPVLVLPAEHPGVDCTALDLEADGAGTEAWVVASAQAILDETSVPTDADQFVARRGAQRFVRRYIRQTVPALSDMPVPLRQQGVYLITGGLGGIGLTLAQQMAARASARVALITRAAFPERGAWDTLVASEGTDPRTTDTIRQLLEIERSGGEVLVVQASIANVEAMRAAVKRIEQQWGGINAIIHAAALAGEGLLASATPADTDDAIAAKVVGLDVLVTLLGDHTLDFVALFSSISALDGAAGASAYSAACAYQDAFAESAEIPKGWPVFSTAWSVWRDVGMATREKERTVFREERAAAIASGILPLEGAEGFLRALGSGLPLLMISPLDIEHGLSARARLRSQRTAGVPSQTTTVSTAGAPSSTATLTSGGMEGVEQQLALVWADLLGTDVIAADDNFFELGGHSLLATRVLARVDRDFGVRLPLRAIFDAPTVEQFASLIVAQMRSAGTLAESAPTGDREEFEL